MSRIILKISGEALKEDEKNVSEKKLNIIKEIIEELKKDKHKIGIVIGGGNYFRGRDHIDMVPIKKDAIGMMGTVINALYISDFLEKYKIKNEVYTPFDFPYLIENFSDSELKEKYENDEIIIFGGGIGKSGFSTDSGASFAAKKVKASLIIKLTTVDGVYDKDPKTNKEAKLFKTLTFNEVIENNYKVMDTSAFKECKENNIDIIVMNFEKYKYLNETIKKHNIGTFIGGSNE